MQKELSRHDELSLESLFQLLSDEDKWALAQLARQTKIERHILAALMVAGNRKYGSYGSRNPPVLDFYVEEQRRDLTVRSWAGHDVAGQLVWWLEAKSCMAYDMRMAARAEYVGRNRNDSWTGLTGDLIKLVAPVAGDDGGRRSAVLFIVDVPREAHRLAYRRAATFHNSEALKSTMSDAGLEKLLCELSGQA